MKILINIMYILLFGQIANAQFVQNNSRSLFSDVKAFRQDDAIMVYIVEDTKADNNATTSSSRETDISAGFGFNAGEANGNYSGNLGTGNSFGGKGGTSRNESIRAKLSARVVEVEPNGNLKIEGQRTTKVNGETQTIVIRGIVRPVDVRSDNSVYSYSILDLTLLIEGDGSVTEVQEPGLITKFLRLLF